MAKQTINNGESGLIVRGKINDNFTELYELEIYVDGVGDGVTDDTSAIQTAVTNNVGKTIVIGKNSEEVYLIDKPINVPSGSRIKVIGTVKMANANERLLAANGSIGQTTLNVTDADVYFKAGQWIGITDDNKPTFNAGGALTRETGDGNYVNSVSSTQITLRTALKSNFTTAANAKVFTANSCFICDSVEDVYIFGNGIIDNNRPNQVSCALVSENEVGIEALRQQCCISVRTGTNINIDGVLCQNGSLHGIAYYGCSKGSLSNFRVEGWMDKGVAMLGLTDYTIVNGNLKDGSNEDGITCYSNNQRVLIDNVKVDGAQRYGFAVVGTPGVNSNAEITFTNCIGYKNKNHILVSNAKDGAVVFNNISTSGLNVTNQGSSVILTNVQNTNFYNINVNGATPTNAGGSAFSIGADCSDINFLGGSVHNLTSRSCFNNAGTRVRFDGFTIGSTNGSLFRVTTNTTYLTNSSVGLAKTAIIDSSGGTNPTLARGFNVKGGSTIRSSNAGNATVANTKTSIIVSHGLFYTPIKSQIILTPTNNLGNSTKYWVSDISETSFKINVDVDPGATTAKFAWVVNDSYQNLETTEPTYTTIYSSDFSAGVDGWSTLNSTVTGNIDSIGGADNNLRFYANASNDVHGISKTSALQNGATNRVTVRVFIPSNTTLNGIRLYMGATSILQKYNTFGLTLNAWNEFTSEEFVATGTTLIIYGVTFGSNSYVGQNIVTDDLCYIGQVITEYR